MHKLPGYCSNATGYGMRNLKQAWNVDFGQTDMRWYKYPMKIRFGCGKHLKVKQLEVFSTGVCIAPTISANAFRRNRTNLSPESIPMLSLSWLAASGVQFRAGLTLKQLDDVKIDCT